jgi:CRP-like cAMP-binding protein
MSTSGITAAFAKHEFLQALGERHLLALASGASPFTAPPGTMLAREGEPAQYFYLIQSGCVAINIHTSKRGDMPIQTVGPGEILGWSWLVEPHVWQFDGRVQETVQGIKLDGEWLREKCEQDHELGYHLLRQLLSVLATRLSSTRRQLLDLYH